MGADAAALSHALEATYKAFNFIGNVPKTLLRPLQWPHFVEAIFRSDPWTSAVVLMFFVAFLCWIVSVVNGNYSQVDRLWSFLPMVYVWHFAFLLPVVFGKGVVDRRLLLMATLATLWSVRLGYNYWRKGGYNVGHEDYRWAALRKYLSPAVFQIFNIFFIALYQNILILLFVSAAYPVWLARGTPLHEADFAIAGLFLLLWLGEAIADQQQWNFQSRKHRLLKEGKKLPEKYAQGFITSGLWRYSRHPNFFCEISMWFTMYLFSVSATGVWLNWSLAGPVLLGLLFQGSTAFTEVLTRNKYQAYRDYQNTTSRLIPWFPGRSVKSPKSSRKSVSKSPSRSPSKRL